jgi:formate-dependent nitrite reductase membrane component NrfD
MQPDALRPAPDYLTGLETDLQRNLPAVPPAGPPAPSYYDIPLLQKPVWTDEIGVYFFLGGLSAGSYILARVAERVGGPRYRAVTRAGTAVAVLALLPCPPLLIADLGDPTRFHHMLRVFKPRSPMSLGSWVLTGYGGILFLTALREWRRDPERPEGLLGKAVGVALDLAGLPLALLFSGYTGVLLSGTSTPVWTKNPWLGPLFTASAIGNGASAITLALEVLPSDGEETRPAVEALEKVDEVAHVAEAVTLTGYFGVAGSLARPLTQGKAAPYFWGAVGCVLASEVVRRLPVSGRARGWTRFAAAAASLASGFCLKWAMQQAGPPSADDPEADRQASRPPRLERW